MNNHHTDKSGLSHLKAALSPSIPACYTVTRGDAQLTMIRVGPGFPRVEFPLEGRQYAITHTTPASPSYVFRQSVLTLGEAERAGALRNRFALEIEGTPLVLSGRPLWAKALHLKESGRRIGKVVRRGVVTCNADAEFPSSWPLPHQIFVLWLALLCFQLPFVCHGQQAPEKKTSRAPANAGEKC